MGFRFPSPKHNPRPDLSDSWREVTREELYACSPPCARAFVSALGAARPDLEAALVFLRHPDDRDSFVMLFGPGAPVGVQFDVDLGYVVVWALEGEPRCGEHGDWGAGLDVQVREALEHVLVLVAG